MNRKGQFMIISAVIAGLLVITLSTAISNIQDREYKPNKLSEHINQLRDEAARISGGPGGITDKEKRNFRKMTSYLENYRTISSFNETANCVQVTLESTDRRVELPCMN